MTKQHSNSQSGSDEHYRCSVAIPIRYADIDAHRHLNNVAYLTFMEQARLVYLREVGLWHDDRFESVGMIVAKVTCTYLQPAYMWEEVRVRIRISHVGTKSFHFEYRMETDRALVATGHSVQVCYDYYRQCSIPMPETWREAIQAYERRPPAQ
jgi:acyl-CoA thioester hydrolase